jgi:serine/threonine protein kinase
VIQEQMEGGRGVSFLFPIAIDILIQIANGLYYLHNHDVAHQDLKPTSILINQYNLPYLQKYLHVKLADFGLLKVRCDCFPNS